VTEAAPTNQNPGGIRFPIAAFTTSNGAVVAPAVVATRSRSALPRRLRPQKLHSWRFPALPNDEVLRGAPHNITSILIDRVSLPHLGSEIGFNRARNLQDYYLIDAEESIGDGFSFSGGELGH
jgi:hypothetical protein